MSVPLLAGHGETPEVLARTGYADWLASAEAALDRLAKDCDRITVAGLSLGATIALNLAIRFPNRIDRVVSINGSTGIYRPDQVSALFGTRSEAFHAGIGSDISHPDRHEICYDRIPAATMRERFVLTSATGVMLPLLRQPILVFQSREDHVVAPENGPRIAREVGSSEVTLRWLDRSFHVATLDYDREDIVRRTSAFVSG